MLIWSLGFAKLAFGILSSFRLLFWIFLLIFDDGHFSVILSSSIIILILSFVIKIMELITYYGLWLNCLKSWFLSNMRLISSENKQNVQKAYAKELFGVADQYSMKTRTISYYYYDDSDRDDDQWSIYRSVFWIVIIILISIIRARIYTSAENESAENDWIRQPILIHFDLKSLHVCLLILSL